MKKSIRLLAILFLLFCFQQASIAQASVNHLRCEYLDKPLGIDVTDPRLSWIYEDNRQQARQASYEVIIGTDDRLVSGQKTTWQSGKIRSDRGYFVYNGPALKPFTRYYWKVNAFDAQQRLVQSAVSWFETGMMQTDSWKGLWIQDTRDINLKPAPYFRKNFNSPKKIVSARAYVAAAGLFELYINGKKIGDHFMDPMYTRFDRRILYVTHDITREIQQGENAVGVLLGNGWYNHQSTAVWYFQDAPWRARPSFCLNIRIRYEDGSEQLIVTDKSWKTSLSPVIFNSIYTAEHYDARLEQPRWSEPGFIDTAWKGVMFRSAPTLNIVSQTLQPVRLTDSLSAELLSQSGDTLYVYRFPKNMSGISRIRLRAEPGTVIRMKHGERLYSNGRVDISNIDAHYRPTDDTDPFQTDIFITKGGGSWESFQPRFNYKGFQYVEVTSSKPVSLTAQSLTAFFAHSDVPVAGTIQSSNIILNKIWEATNQSYLSNLFGYPTDCPHREKNGWTGDAQIASETGLFNFDAITIYEKWLADHRDEQQLNGVLPAIIPTSGWGYEWANGPDWTSTIAIIPWNVYLFYGDDRLLKQSYESIRRYVDYINEQYPDGITSWGLGDWIPVKSQSPVDLTSTAYYYTDVKILAEAARLFNKKEDYLKYQSLAKKIKAAFNAKFYNKNKGIYGSGLQTELSVPLMWGLVPDSLVTKVASNLAKRIEADGWKLDVGLLGTKAILNALSENGYAQIAYRLATAEAFPSWGWWIKNGATTLYENWPIEAKSDISMNHIMFGEIGAWMYKALGGIRPDPQSPGFKNILLEPHFVEGLDHFEAKHQSPYGQIRSNWKRENGRILFEFTIPAAASAMVRLETGGKTVMYQQKRLMPVDGFVKITCNSGTHSITLQ